MKYTKPKWEATVIPVVPNAVVSFFHSLPAEFEIVEPGNVQVRWPDGATREAISDAAAAVMQQCRYPPHEISSMLCRIAAIAPVEKKKRMVWLWKHESWSDTMPPHSQFAGESMFTDGLGGWRKIGECEVDA